MSRNTLICDSWEFSKNPVGTLYEDAKDWKKVDIPHDWLIYNTNDLYETSTGWYRRRISYAKKEGMRAAVRFEGVYMDSRVYVNGALAGEWKYGYSTFEFDITDLLEEGENELSVRVDYRSPNSRWYSGAGIYRKVIFKEFPDTHLLSDGLYISADTEGNVTVSCEAERPEDAAVDGLAVRWTVIDSENRTVCVTPDSLLCACDKSALPEVLLREGCSYSVNTYRMKIPSPRLWDIDDPYLYKMKAELLKNGEVIDSDESVFGLKKAEFTTDRGFFLNGRHLKLHGSCEHHDLGALGAAVNRNAIRRKLLKLREMGVNAIRTSHNMPAAELMELADEMGFLILSEGFDMWERPKTEYDYGNYFKEWVPRDVASWIRRDRNHPSVIGWSVGNEIYDTHADEHGQEIASRLLHLVRLHDPRNNGYVTIGSNYMQWDNAQKCADIVKLAGYNYAERLYNEHHEKHPDWMIYGSETASVVQSRGIYHFPYSQSMLSDDDEQCSSLGNSSTGWGAKSSEACIIPDRDAQFCAGQFIWTGFDYIGEPTPYSTKNSYFGQIDTAGFFKDSAYIFRAEWTDFKKSPFIHVFPYWDFAEGQDIDVRAVTNAPHAELYFNGKKIAEKDIDHLHGKELSLNVIIPYEKGEITAVAFDGNGKEVARDSVRSFGDTAELRLTPESDCIRADGEDLLFLDISAYDKDGTFTANANNRVFVEVTGAGRLLGLDNGDSTDFEQYKTTSRRLFSGKLLAIIGARDFEGDINIKVTSPGLPECTLTVPAVKARVKEGISYNEECSRALPHCPDENSDIPVRRIDFISDSRVFTPERDTIIFRPVIYPGNASYTDEIEYKLTTVTGIETNTAEIIPSEEGTVAVHCKGDGEFYLRALCKNGTDRYHVLCPIKLTGEGMGAAVLDPYSFVTAGLYTIQSGNMANGIEHGAGFMGERCWFGFEGLDFGPIGSDTLTIPIYSLHSEPVRLRIFDGDPDNGGELLGDYMYSKPGKWLTYVPDTFKLNRRLKGTESLVFMGDVRYEIKGFEFEKPVKELSELCAADCENIYGDKFTVEKDCVSGIGNNVVIDFGEFDFTDIKPSRLIIKGRSRLPVNSIHLIAAGNTEERILCEFTAAEDYTERAFDITVKEDKCRISLAFLPGSDFDLRSIRFEK